MSNKRRREKPDRGPNRMLLTLAVSELAKKPNGEDMVWQKQGEDGEMEDLPVEDQPTLGNFMLFCLRQVRPPDQNPAQVVHLRRIEERISDAIKKREPYVVGQYVLNILQSGWREAMKMAVQERPDNGIMAQVAVALNLQPAATNEDMTGLETDDASEDEQQLEPGDA